jgi:hypothetical protein
MFNLIVGTGALTMPKAFAQAGWAVSLALISFLAFMRRVPRRLTAFTFISTMLPYIHFPSSHFSLSTP